MGGFLWSPYQFFKPCLQQYCVFSMSRCVYTVPVKSLDTWLATVYVQNVNISETHCSGHTCRYVNDDVDICIIAVYV